MALSRKEQIFAKTTSVGGKRKAVSAPKQASGINHTLATNFSKNELVRTAIESVSFKLDDKIHTVENAQVKSVMKNKSKQIAYIVQGNEKIDEESNVLNALPKDLYDHLQKS